MTGTSRARGWLTLAVLLASCGPPEAPKDARLSPTPPAPPKALAQPDQKDTGPADTAPAAEQQDGPNPRPSVFDQWVEQAERDCQRTKDPEAYLPVREGASAEDTDAVKTRCAAAAELGLRGKAWRAALDACVHRFVITKGAGKPACQLARKDVADVPASLLDRHVTQCSSACAEAGPEALALEKERRQQVTCCDGTLSPTCTGERIGPGCCAGHKGVCIGD